MSRWNVLLPTSSCYVHTYHNYNVKPLKSLRYQQLVYIALSTLQIRRLLLDDVECECMHSKMLMCSCITCIVIVVIVIVCAAVYWSSDRENKAPDHTHCGQDHTH